MAESNDNVYYNWKAQKINAIQHSTNKEFKSTNSKM